MAELDSKLSTSPPKKRRDPALLARSQDEKQKKHEEYIGEIVESSVRQSLQEGTIPPKSVHLVEGGKLKLSKLLEKLNIDEKNMLNQAFAYGYNEAQQNLFSVQELRQKLETIVKEPQPITFEMVESNLQLVLNGGIEDAYFIYINSGLELLYHRLIAQKELPPLFSKNFT